MKKGQRLILSKEECPREYEKPAEHCPTCDECDCQDGRWLPAVNCYASTCDDCGELCHHELQEMDEETQLGYCPACVEKRKELE